MINNTYLKNLILNKSDFSSDKTKVVTAGHSNLVHLTALGLNGNFEIIYLDG